MVLAIFDDWQIFFARIKFLINSRVFICNLQMWISTLNIRARLFSRVSEFETMILFEFLGNSTIVVGSTRSSTCKKLSLHLISGTLHVSEASASSSSREIHGVNKIVPWDLRNKRTRGMITVFIRKITFIFASNLN